MELTQERIRELFEYREDGNLVWKIKKARANAGDVAGCEVMCNGVLYKQVKVDAKSHKLHRLVFAWHYGFMPAYVDHIDRDGLNNRVENLREATQSQNMQNCKMKSSNTSSARNVYWHARACRWFVRLTIDGKTKNFGTYKNLEEASVVAHRAREQHYGNFARHN